MPDITVVIPTFCRPAGLHRAAKSVLAQEFDQDYQLLIVDNDPNGSARAAAEEIIAKAPDHVVVRYVHEPKAGVANARNTAIAEVVTSLVAFLDDDQSAPLNWLSELYRFHAHSPAPVTFGPVVTELPDSVTRHRVYLEDFFSRELDVASGYIDTYFGCGNALFDLSLIARNEPLFDTAMNETGGEDDILFQSLMEQGKRFGWCAEAPAFEHVPVPRARLKYTLKRAFGYGQGPITLARKSTPKRYGRIVMWMCVGLAKALINGALYIGHWIARSPNRASYLDKAVRGTGKVFWWVNLKFYGAGALRNF